MGDISHWNFNHDKKKNSNQAKGILVRLQLGNKRLGQLPYGLIEISRYLNVKYVYLLFKESEE